MNVGQFVIRLILCFLFPPLAVLDKGCGMILLIFLLCFLGWLPATFVALFICCKDKGIFFNKQQQIYY